jgi:cytochrome c oxidase cbb3-type subunit III
MNGAWSWYVIVLTSINIIGLIWLLIATASSKPVNDKPIGETMGHVWDGDLEELNNPLPRWWLGLFIITFIFALGYLVFYPGFGNLAGSLGWTSAGQVQNELDATHAKLESLYAGFRNQPIAALADNPAATKVGRNVFANNCAACHGSDARGAKGYPNLVDSDWLYGGEPETVLASIMGGRQGMMPPLGATLPGTGVDEVANYALSLSGLDHDKRLAAAGKTKFETICAACHGVDGKGNHAIGAPNLTDDIWLHGNATLDGIRQTNQYGARGVMPVWGPIIGEDRARLAAAWVLSQGKAAADSEREDDKEGRKEESHE